MVCLYLHTGIALYRTDRNEKLLEMFAYLINSRVFYEQKLNLQNRVLEVKTNCIVSYFDALGWYTAT